MIDEGIRYLRREKDLHWLGQASLADSILMLSELKDELLEGGAIDIYLSIDCDIKCVVAEYRSPEMDNERARRITREGVRKAKDETRRKKIEKRERKQLERLVKKYDYHNQGEAHADRQEKD